MPTSPEFLPRDRTIRKYIELLLPCVHSIHRITVVETRDRANYMAISAALASFASTRRNHNHGVWPAKYVFSQLRAVFRLGHSSG